MYYVFGNHDRGYYSEAAKGWTNAQLREKLKENGVVIAEKALQQSNIAVTGTEGKVIRWIVIAVIPLIVALAGTIVLLRRRNK